VTVSPSTTVSSDGNLVPQDTAEVDSQAMMDIDSEATVDVDFNAMDPIRSVSSSSFFYQVMLILT